jgi:CotH kinase protein
MKKLYFVLAICLPCLLSAQTPIKPAERPLFDTRSIGEIRIDLPMKNWTEVLDSMRLYGNEMAVGTITIDGKRYEGAGIRYRGDKSYQQGLKRNPFSIKLNYTDKSQNHQGHTGLKISSSLRDPSMVREILFYEIANKYMPAPDACYIKMYVNSEYIGLFINIESVDSQFLTASFGSDNKPLFKAGVDYKPQVPAVCKSTLNGALEFEDNIECYKGNFESANSNGWADLQQLTKVLNNDMRSIERLLDVDRVLWMLALNNVMVNLNSYTGSATNYYLYQDNNGRFQPIHWDLNLGFGSYKNLGSGSDLELRDLQRMDPLLHADNPYRPLISQLLKEPLYRKIYLAHVRQIVNEHFKNGNYEKRAQELQSNIVVAFNDDKYKTYTLADFQSSLKATVGRKSKIPGIVELMSARSKFLDDHAELTTLASAVSDITNQSRGKFENQRVNGFRITAKADRFPKRMWIYYRFSSNESYVSMPMEEEQGRNLASGTRMFVANIEAKSEDAIIEYYLLTENAGAVAFSPINYTQQPHKVKLSDLNK